MQCFVNVKAQNKKPDFLIIPIGSRGCPPAQKMYVAVHEEGGGAVKEVTPYIVMTLNFIFRFRIKTFPAATTSITNRVNCCI